MTAYSDLALEHLHPSEHDSRLYWVRGIDLLDLRKRLVECRNEFDKELEKVDWEIQYIVREHT